MPKFYVAPVPNWLRGLLSNFNRLYAYPNIPEVFENNTFTILDSGAFHLFMAKKKMTLEYIDNLAEHYLKYSGKNIFCVTPDVPRNYIETIKNFQYFYTKYDIVLSPVIQCSNESFLIHEIDYQLKAYKEILGDIDYLFFNKRGKRFAELIETKFDSKLEYCKKEYGVNRIHIFGGGWGLEDVNVFKKFKYADSIDSIAYYTASINEAQNLREFKISGKTKQERAIKNLELCNKILS
jgi:hypothetical protein